ncbi:MAG: complex I subunit 1/NuoH family protein [Candidatus Ranarchaeia archaeon]
MMDIIDVFRIVVFPGFVFFLVLVMFCEWFSRKVFARMQNRRGPTQAGPLGILQPLADFLKLLLKEDIDPHQARRSITFLMPLLTLSLYIYSLTYFPWDGQPVIRNSGFEGDLLLLLTLVTFAHFALFLSGWSSRNPYSLIGGSRVLVQFLGYDIPLILLAAAPAFLSQSLSIQTIISNQSVPYILVIPWIFVIFIFILQAEMEKDPFDTTHAETELVAGYGTEFSGKKMAFINLAQDFEEVFGAALTAVLFLGGPSGPVFFGVPAFWSIFWFIIKILAVIVLLEFIRAMVARFRIDQVVKLNWRYLTPITLVSLILTIWAAPLLANYILFLEALL